MQQSDEIMSYFLAMLKSALSIVTLLTLQYFAKPLFPVSLGHYRFSKRNWKQGLRHKICSVGKVIIWGMRIRWIKRNAASDKFLNDNDVIGKCLWNQIRVLTNHSRSSEEHSTMPRVCSRICQTPSRSVGSWKAWKD